MDDNSRPSPIQDARYFSYGMGLFLLAIIVVIFGMVLSNTGPEVLATIVLLAGFTLTGIALLLMKFGASRMGRSDREVK